MSTVRRSPSCASSCARCPSSDHRIIDGHAGAAFAYEIIGYLEDPDRLFLEMS
ncbi:2-oxo acid dehydrogenase subunit E2 [Sorangium sp. So ce296]|uniref:2-oxo acid dehydrogenase subunit E2 n=1 Tax=Sorangium sp. So ce296 TaxID=3133296 RepID=UPI003F62DD99